MTAHCPSTLGECPSCGSDIGDADVLIQYETADGVGVYADCPDCREVVSPR